MFSAGTKKWSGTIWNSIFGLAQEKIGQGQNVLGRVEGQGNSLIICLERDAYRHSMTLN